ncbi:MAG: cupin domain-containing protein [Burkholderiales bacterium]|jgi:uncharacterized cupin superfamily protein
MSATSPVVNLSDIQTKERGNGKKFVFKQARIGPLIGLEKLGCGLISVPPGKAAFPYHAHSSMEEMCIVLAGTGVLRQDDVTFAIKEGDVIASGIGKAHQIVNTGSVDLRYLVISNNEKVDVVVYPDSKKTLAVSETLGPLLFHMTKQDATADYYDGEDE